VGIRKYLEALKSEAKTPPYLLFFVTARCDAKCKHCFFWRSTNQVPDELTFDEIDKISAHTGEILQITLTGGDAAKRDDLPAIAEIFANRNHALNITVATNGYQTTRVLAQIAEMTRILPAATNLTVDLSLDGVGEGHDRLRNCPGIFDALTQTVKGLHEIKRTMGRPNICLNTTVSYYNQDKLRPVYECAVNELKPDIINALYIRGEPREPQAKQVNVERYREFCRWIREDTARGKIPGYNFFTDTLHAKDFILRDIIMDTVRTGRYRYPCTAARLTGVIYPDGDVAACELLPYTLGNLRRENYDLAKIWTSDRTRAVRHKIAYGRCHCIHQCFLSNNILFNPTLFPRLLAETARLKWARLSSSPAGQTGNHGNG
jgi:MoaA/NifB/PqqE/SkfB family radical SAM enzyme